MLFCTTRGLATATPRPTRTRMPSVAKARFRLSIALPEGSRKGRSHSEGISSVSARRSTSQPSGSEPAAGTCVRRPFARPTWCASTGTAAFDWTGARTGSASGSAVVRLLARSAYFHCSSRRPGSPLSTTRASASARTWRIQSPPGRLAAACDQTCSRPCSKAWRVADDFVGRADIRRPSRCRHSLQPRGGVPVRGRPR